MKKKAPDPMSPSLDHILPLSKGGTHEPRNVQLAHLGCNVRKYNSGVDQLRLLP
jgi:5-methylcytosine-specific restriction endonuclease McrA